jgi:hypothetical protein
MPCPHASVTLQPGHSAPARRSTHTRTHTRTPHRRPKTHTHTAAAAYCAGTPFGRSPSPSGKRTPLHPPLIMARMLPCSVPLGDCSTDLRACMRAKHVIELVCKYVRQRVILEGQWGDDGHQSHCVCPLASAPAEALTCSARHRAPAWRARRARRGCP